MSSQIGNLIEPSFNEQRFREQIDGALRNVRNVLDTTKTLVRPDQVSGKRKAKIACARGGCRAKSVRWVGVRRRNEPNRTTTNEGCCCCAAHDPFASRCDLLTPRCCCCVWRVRALVCVRAMTTNQATHTYVDKFSVVEIATRQMMVALRSCLEVLGASEETWRVVREWSAAKSAVSLVFVSARRRCRLWSLCFRENIKQQRSVRNETRIRDAHRTLKRRARS